MRIAMLGPVAWRTPPRHYGPWEQVVSLLTEGLVKRGVEVTLFATADSETGGRLHAVAPRGYEEDRDLDPKVWECLHISEVFEWAGRFDLIHNHFDFLPLSYSGLVKTPMVTTIHGFSSPRILPVYRKYNRRVHYVAISKADRSPDLDYAAVVHHGIDLGKFTFRDCPEDYLLFFGRIHPDKGTREAVEIARACGIRLIIAGIIQDHAYFDREVRPWIDGDRVSYLGSAGGELRDKLMGNALALLHPIAFDEPFGLSVVESMACGTPVIAFPRGSMPELIRDGENGFLVSDVSGAVEAVSRLSEISRGRCRKIAEDRFSADRMVEDYLRVYRQILGGISPLAPRGRKAGDPEREVHA
ncbi:MAG: glycosyltransferase family 4 protein [Firmicutes bacterium]|nr:glycosyltransferase family 4 protein [Bacillota bacterium]